MSPVHYYERETAAEIVKFMQQQISIRNKLIAGQWVLISLQWGLIASLWGLKIWGHWQ